MQDKKDQSSKCQQIVLELWSKISPTENNDQMNPQGESTLINFSHYFSPFSETNSNSPFTLWWLAVSKQTKFELGPIIQTIFTGKGKSPLSLKDDILSKILVMPPPLIVFYKLTRTRLLRWYISCLRVPNSTFGQLELLWWEKRHRICRLQLWTNRSKISGNIMNSGPHFFSSLVFCYLPRVFILTSYLNEQLFTYLVKGSTICI